MRTPDWLKRLYGSVFARLFLVLLATGFSINFLVGAFFSHAFHHSIKESAKTTAMHYLGYILTELGDPPDLEAARRIAAGSFIDIRYEGLHGSWQTGAEMPAMEAIRWYDWHMENRTRIGRSHGRYFLEMQRPEGRFVFSFTRLRQGRLDKEHLVFLLLGGLTLILVVAFLVIRRILKPVKRLRAGVRAVGGGDLEHRVPTGGADEFHELAGAFNDMVARLTRMIHDREQLLLDVSHELRSPLTRIRMALEFMEEGRTRKSIADDIGEMEKMVAEILETARLKADSGQVKTASCNLVEALADVVAQCGDRSPGVALPSSLSPAVVVAAEPELLITVLRNVLDNALKYSTGSKTAVSLSLAEENETVILKVTDRGPGIPADELDQVFEPFYRVDKSRSRETGGYGLGLNLCRTIMGVFGGRIAIDSEPGEGTTVILTFRHWRP